MLPLHNSPMFRAVYILAQFILFVKTFFEKSRFVFHFFVFAAVIRAAGGFVEKNS